MDPICEEKHKRIDEKLDLHERRLNAHSDQLDVLSVSDARNTNEITNLCKQIAELVQTIRWFIGLLVASFVGFFFYAVQTGLFK